MTVSFANSVAHNQLDWTTFKTIMSSKKMLMQHEENGESHTIFSFDGDLAYSCRLWKAGAKVSGIPESNDADLADFVANHLATVNRPMAPRNADGNPLSSPTFMETGGATGKISGDKWQVAKGAQAFFDKVVTTQIYLQGGSGWYLGAVDGDYVEFSIIDKDNVTGMFDGTDPNGMNPGLLNLGLVVGTDILEMGKFVETRYLQPGDHAFTIDFDSKTNVAPGLYMRASYFSVGASIDPILAANYKWYEV